MLRRGVIVWLFPVGIIVLIAFFVVVSVTAFNTGQAAQVQAQYRLANCNAAIGPWNSGDSKQSNQNLSVAQLGIVAQIISIGKARNLPPEAWQIAIQAGMQESSLTNVDHGDAAGPDSRGIFQMRPSQGWGTPEQVMDVNYEINKFYDVLLKVPGWQTMPPGNAAQAVERSAFPDAYDKWAVMAADLIKNTGGVQDPTGCGKDNGTALPASQAAAKAIAYAQRQLGKPYVWGGNGPDGYDCSGLVQQAYLAAGITLPRVADAQYKAGAHLKVTDAQPGDLVFLATDPSNPVTIHHVAMYLGDHKIIEAQDFGIPIHIRPFSFTEAEVVPEAVRPGV